MPRIEKLVYEIQRLVNKNKQRLKTTMSKLQQERNKRNKLIREYNEALFLEKQSCKNRINRYKLINRKRNQVLKELFLIERKLEKLFDIILHQNKRYNHHFESESMK